MTGTVGLGSPALSGWGRGTAQKVSFQLLMWPLSRW